MSQLDAITIPDKTYFKIGEVAKLLDLEPYVLRYWESEFDVLDPDKTDSGQRVYQREDIELIVQIRDLLYNEMFTIAGARRQLELEREGKPNFVGVEASVDTGRTDELEAENAELREQVEELSARLQEKEDVQPDMWEERLAAQTEQVEALEIELAEANQTIASQSEQIEALEVELAEAHQTIARLEDKVAQASNRGLDPRIVRGLREQLQGLARAAQRPV